ncbi:MAG: hypothetical protein EOL87_14085 [Spartobacteria bacterium]|nr:hypothetical protein [Spartobacteria bacterium]
MNDLTTCAVDEYKQKHRGWPLTSLITVMVMAALIGWIAADFPLKLSFLFFCGACVLTLTLFKPVWALYLLVVALVLLNDSEPKEGGTYFVITDPDVIKGLPSVICTYMLTLTGILGLQMLFKQRERPPVSLAPLFILSGIVLLAALTGFIGGWDVYMIQFDATNFLFPALFFYLCVTLLNSREQIITLVHVLIGIAGLKALILAVFYIAGHGWPYQLDAGGESRIATMDSADLLVYITLVLIVFNMFLEKRLSRGQSWCFATACLPMLFVIIFAYRRAQWVGLVFSLGLLFLLTTTKNRKKMTILLLAAILLITSILMLSSLGGNKLGSLTERFYSVFDPQQHSNVYHLLETQQTMRDIAGKPISGLGLGSHHSPLGLYENDLVPTNIVHNTFLYIWMKLGLPGLLFFSVIGYQYIHRILRYRSKRQDEEGWIMLLPIASSLGLWLAMFLTGPTPWYFHQTFLIALFAAMGVSLMLQEPLQKETP